MTRGHISAPSGLLRQVRKEGAGDAERIVGLLLEGRAGGECEDELPHIAARQRV